MTACKRLAAVATLACLSALLTGCLFQPGTFDATLHIRSDRQFTFDYDGEIVLAGLTQLAEMAQEADTQEPCWNEEFTKERPCSEEELAERAQDDAMSQAMLASMGGDMDLNDPEQVAEMIAMLERQAGWNSVEFMGDGVFMVDFSLTSTLSHDFDFPTFEDMPMSNAFVQVRLRDGNRARIAAPGFAPAAGNPFGAMMLGMFGAVAEAGEQGEASPVPAIRPPQGTFRIVTDARILANNTDDGPASSAAGEVLTWDIDAGTNAAPTALIEFAR